MGFYRLWLDTGVYNVLPYGFMNLDDFLEVAICRHATCRILEIDCTQSHTIHANHVCFGHWYDGGFRYRNFSWAAAVGSWAGTRAHVWPCASICVCTCTCLSVGAYVLCLLGIVLKLEAEIEMHLESSLYLKS